MRFDTPIYFRRVTAGLYDAETGDYGPDNVTEVKVYASVTDASREALALEFGDIKQGGKVIRLQNHYAQPFDNIRIGAKIYRAGSSRALRTKQTFIVTEVQ